MKLSLAIKITLKDYFPKWKSIPYDNFVCLINYNSNLISKIKFSDLPENNCINHKVESFNSNIIYNFHVLDLYKKSLIGVCHLCINFDKIKNLNVNDTLTQEGNFNLFIDSITKRKFFDNITNMGDIYLFISAEIKIINKKLIDAKKYKRNYNSLNKENINLSNIIKFNNANKIYLNSTNKNFKKKEIIKTMQNNYDSLNKLDTLYCTSEFNTNTNTNTKIFDENDYNTFNQCATGVKKNKSTYKSKVNLKNIIKYNNNFNNNNQCNFNNSCTEIMSPKYNSNTYNKRKNNSKKKSRIGLNKNKLVVLNLMEEQNFGKSNTKENIYTNLFEPNVQINDLYKFSQTQMGKNFNRKDYNTYNTFNKLGCELKEKKDGKSFGEADYYKKKNKNKIQINLFGKNENSTERKLKCKKNLSLIDYSRINTEIMSNNNYISNNKNISINNNTNINNIFLQTEAMTTKAQKFRHHKISINKKILRNLNIKQLITGQTKYQNNILMEQTRGTFSPKLSLQNKFDENILQTESNDRFQTRNKERLSRKMMTPKGSKIKYVTLNFTFEKNKNKMNEELRKKLLSIMDCYSLLMKKIKFNYENNKEFAKRLQEIKERCNNLNKCENKIINLKNANESKKVIHHTLFHFEEEKLLTDLVNIKLKENSINRILFGDIEKNTNTINKINSLISKKEETVLNLIKNVVKYYGNISQIYNEETDKKNKLIKILEKYDIKEKNQINLNYINYMNKTNNFNDKVITEVDEDKENEEDFEEHYKNNNIIFDEENNIQEIKITFPSLKNKNKIEANIDNETNYNENSNNFIENILIEQFPKKYNTDSKFILLEKNKYLFKDKIFLAFIENNDVILTDEIQNNIYNLNEFYNTFCNQDKIENKRKYIYTKKIRQKYIKIKSYEDKESNTDKKMKNENNTTMDTDFIQQSMISKGNEISEEKI